MEKITNTYPWSISFQDLFVFIAVLLISGCNGAPADAPSVADEASGAMAKPWPQRDLAFAECMVIAARESYSPLDETPARLCDAVLTEPFEHLDEYGADVLRVFKRQFDSEGQAHVEIVIAFTGTRAPDTGDIARDLESQILVDYNNELIDERTGIAPLSGDEKVGGGFDSRWENFASIVKDAIIAIESDASASSQNQDSATSIMIVGHSLGAATATRAAFDLNRSLAGRRIVLWSFNSPRIGNTAFAQAYADSIVTCELQDSGCFMVRQFTRSGDPIHKLPLLMKHPVWNPDLDEDKRKSTGEVAERELDYCAHYHAPKESTLNLPQNHKLDLWRVDLYAIPPGHLECMFGAE